MRMQIVVLIMLLLIPAANAQPERPLPVSLIALIANPERFDSKLVAVQGYLHLAQEDDTLYVSESDYLHSLLKNGIWLHRTKEMEGDIEKLDLKYVVIVGIFRAHNLGHMSASSGALDKVRSCTFLSDPKYPIVRRLEDERKKAPK